MEPSAVGYSICGSPAIVSVCLRWPIEQPLDRRALSLPTRLGKLERIRSRGDHQRGERVPQVVEVEPLEVGVPDQAWLPRA